MTPAVKARIDRLKAAGICQCCAKRPVAFSERRGGKPMARCEQCRDVQARYMAKRKAAKQAARRPAFTSRQNISLGRKADYPKSTVSWWIGLSRDAFYVTCAKEQDRLNNGPRQASARYFTCDHADWEREPKFRQRRRELLAS